MGKVLSFFLTVAILVAAAYWLEEKFQISQYVFADEPKSKSSREKLVLELREGMLKREDEISVKILADADAVEDLAVSAVQEVFRIDDEASSNDFDYLKFHYSGMTAQIRGYGKVFRLDYHMEYLDSKAEEEAVDEEVERVLKKLSLAGKSDLKKIKSIHDYIVKNTRYDLSVVNNSAYEALISGASACQGYAALTYKMMTEAGIPCRIIAGTAKGEPHAWNIVKLEGLWYNLDCTWDDPVGAADQDYIDYDYFLKSNEDFKNHQRDEEYNAAGFQEEYKMAGYSTRIIWQEIN